MKYFREKFLKKIAGIWYICYLYHGRNGYELRIAGKNTHFTNHLKGKEAIYVAISEDKIRLTYQEKKKLNNWTDKEAEEVLTTWLECQEFNRKSEPIQQNLFTNEINK